MRTDKIDEILHRKLYNAEPSVDAPSWEKFEAKQKRKPKAKYWYISTTAVAASLTIIMCLTIFNDTVTISTDIEKHTATIVTDTTEFIENTVATGTDINKISNNAYGFKPVKISAIDKSIKGGDKTPEISPNIVESQDTDQPQKPQQQEQPQKPIKQKEKSIYNPNWRAGIDRETNPNRMLAMAVYTNIPSNGSGRSSRGDIDALFNKNDDGTAQRAPGSAIIQMGPYQQEVDFSDSDLTHKFPITIGASVSLPLGKGFSAESGLVYTYLESTASTTKDSRRYKYTQSIHYLGIPLAAAYKIVENKTLDLYASAGVMAEMAILTEGKTEINTTEDKYLSAYTKKLNPKGVQFSANAALGLNIHLTPKLGLYFEPGITHLIPNSDQPVAWRSKSPVQFNMRAGLKIQL